MDTNTHERLWPQERTGIPCPKCSCAMKAKNTTIICDCGYQDADLKEIKK